MPWSLRIALIVLRATWWSRLFSPPRFACSPSRVLVRHADHEGGDIRLGAGATGDSLRRPGVFLGDEPAVPPEDRVRGDDARDVPEVTPTERLSLHSQAAPLVVSEPEPAGTALRAQDGVLRAPVTPARCSE